MVNTAPPAGVVAMPHAETRQPRSGVSSRLHYFDAVRALLMLLGIPYHVFRIYSSGQDNFFNAEELSVALNFASSFPHSFRMEAFFAIAGFFSYMILVRGTTSAWLRSRFTRIALPLLFCTLLLAPIMTGAVVFAEIRLGLIATEAGWSSWVERMLTRPGSWVYHLWFLHSLLLLCFVLAGIRALVHRVGPAQDLLRAVEGMVGRIAALPAFVACSFFAAFCAAGWIAILIVQGPIGINLSPFGPVFRLGKTAQFLPFFLLGAMMARSTPLFALMTKRSLAILLTAIAASLLFAMMASGLLPTGSVQLGRLLGAVAIGVAGVFWLHALLSQASVRLVQHNAVISYFAAGSYTIYLVHLPIALWLGALMIGVPLPPVAKALIVMVLTFGLSVLCNEGVRRVPLLQFLMNGIPLGKAKAPAVPGQQRA